MLHATYWMLWRKPAVSTSRNSIEPRFQLMLGYTGAYRTDFSEAIMPHKVYPVRDTDSRLRKIVLNKNMLG